MKILISNGLILGLLARIAVASHQFSPIARRTHSGHVNEWVPPPQDRLDDVPPVASSVIQSCNQGEILFEFLLSTDNRPEQTSWMLMNSDGSTEFAGFRWEVDDFDPNQDYFYSYCIPSDPSYELLIMDDGGNGLSGGNEGGYVVFVDGSLVEEKDDPNFGYSESIYLGYRGCGLGEIQFEFILWPDDEPGQTSWDLFDDGVGMILGQDADDVQLCPFAACHTLECLPDTAYVLTIYDSVGNGMSSDAHSSPGYNLYVDGQSIFSQMGPQDFGFEISHAFGEPASRTCSGNNIAFEFWISPDDFPTETTWELVDSEGNRILGQDSIVECQDGGCITEDCLPGNIEYILTIFDDYGDGLKENSRSNPGYLLILNGFEVFFGAADDFGDEISYSFGGTGSACDLNNEIEFDFLVLPDDSPQELNWQLVDSSGSIVLRQDDLQGCARGGCRTVACIPDDLYTLTLEDSQGDGLSNESDTSPSYSLVLDGDEVFSGGAEIFRTITFDFGFSRSCDIAFALTVATDEYGDEDTGWEVASVSSRDTMVQVSVGDYESMNVYIHYICLGDESYAFDFLDDYGDGFICNTDSFSYLMSPGYSLDVNGVNIVTVDGFDDDTVECTPNAHPMTFALVFELDDNGNVIAFEGI